MKRAGFTLIELSIVLVIIGLIIGGVLVGQDLIRAAEIRATVAQKEKFDSAANAFKLKYGALPGDIVPTAAASFGLFQLTGSCGSVCNPYKMGNGRLDTSRDAGSSMYLYENLVFWRHLSEANLIEGTFGRDGTNPINPVDGSQTTSGSTHYKLFLPATKFKGFFWSVAEPSRVSSDTGSYTVPGWAANYEIVTSANTLYLPPVLAYALDSKIDDGNPNTGSMVEFTGAADYSWDVAATPGFCTYGGTTNYSADNKYNVNPDTGGNRPACYVAIRSGF